ncbi:gamma-glutamyl-gamma-aminobutyrate hydrolase [Chromatiales bacterium (ex Bugula neritina AB1)]|nr:gamma-glutamyl-gamma-aminobutyrate hydrolase [Chromatiales bacterium (ex Bugula neritina AB1)]
MTKPVVGIIGNSHLLHDRFDVQLTGLHNFRAVVQVADALPLMFAGDPAITDIDELLNIVDGILLTGARANVHPELFNTRPQETYEPYDRERDGLALPLIRECVERGVPLLGICRGFQEMNVAFGGTLHPEIRDVPGRMNHRMPRLENGEIHPDPTVVFGERHGVQLTSGGVFEKMYGRSNIQVNSLHGQAILEPGERVVIEGVAEDETIEAIQIAQARGFALGVQWHAEYDCTNAPVNHAVFEHFGRSLLEYKNNRS